MIHPPRRRRATDGLLALAALAICLSFLAIACSKKPAPVVEEASPAPPPASSAEVLELAPLVEDAGAAPVEAGPARRYSGGGGGNANQTKIRACCGAMRSQAKTMGNSPESFQLNALAAQCDVFANQVGPAGDAPELNQVRQMLKSVKLPAACSF